MDCFMTLWSGRFYDWNYDIVATCLFVTKLTILLLKENNTPFRFRFNTRRRSTLTNRDQFLRDRASATGQLPERHVHLAVVGFRGTVRVASVHLFGSCDRSREHLVVEGLFRHSTQQELMVWHLETETDRQHRSPLAIEQSAKYYGAHTHTHRGGGREGERHTRSI